MSLWSLFLTNRDRGVHKWTHYFPIYERHFAAFRNTSFTIFEIGVSHGGSLQLWKKYFGPLATIVGVDLNPECAAFEEAQIHIRIGNQSDTVLLRSLVDEFGAPDIVVDDGSHMMSDIKATFDYLYPLMPSRSVYLVEDLHTAYWDAWEGGLRREGSFIEYCKDMIDALHATYTHGQLAESTFSKNTLSMHFYDSVVVFEKGRFIRSSEAR
jgi:hypothetical protein